MKPLITMEEHFISEKISRKCTDIIMQCGTEADKQARQPMAGQSNPLSADIGEGRIAYMDKMGIDTQILSYIDALPSKPPAEYAISLCREANDEMHAASICQEWEYPNGRSRGLPGESFPRKRCLARR